MDHTDHKKDDFSNQGSSIKGRMRSSRIKRRRKEKLLTVLPVVYIVAVISFGALIFNSFAHDSGEETSGGTSFLSIKNEKKAPAAEETSATLLATGDIIMHKPFLNSSTYLNSDGTYDYNSIFKYIKEDYEAADFATTTVEGSITAGDYFGYPTFRSPEAILTALKDNGMDMVLMGNNHVYDNLDEGLQTTADYIAANDMLYTGVRKSIEDKPYQVQDINGIKIGFVDYVYETEQNGAEKSINGIPVSDASAPLINSFNSADLDSFYKEIESYRNEMEEEGAEFTVAYMHWGVEYDTAGTAEQKAMAQKLCDMGFDALIGSHPHVIQPVDLLTSEDGSHKMVCAYAIGNQVSNQRTEYMDGLTYGYSEDGYMVRLTVKKDSKGKVAIDDASFIPIWLYHSLKGGGEYYVLPLDEPDTLAEKTGLDLGTDVEDSLGRTNAIITDGVNKVKDALPIS